MCFLQGKFLYFDQIPSEFLFGEPIGNKAALVQVM